VLPGIESQPSKLSHPALKVTHYPGKSAKKRGIYQVANVGTDTKITVHNKSINNLERGVCERVFYVKDPSGEFVAPPRPLEKIYSKMNKIRDFIVSHLSPTAVLTHAEFVSSYDGRKKTIYTNAVTSLESRSIRVTDSHIKVFGKIEKTNQTAKPDPVQRVVSPRDPRFNVEVGKYLKPVEHKIYQAFAKLFGEVTIAKGLNLTDVGALIQNKFNRYANCIAIGLDASRFDQHVSLQALKWEHGFYKKHFKSNELNQLLSWQEKNVCSSYLDDGKLKYKVSGTRMSGDMNTSLGNCIIMCSLIYQYCQEIGLKKYSLINNGDDCVVFMSKKNENKFQAGLDQWFRDMGFDMKVEPTVNLLERVEFCQTRPVWDGERYIMVRNPKVSLVKDSMFIKPLETEKSYYSWLGYVGDGGMSLSGGIPVFQEFYESFRRASEGWKRVTNDVHMRGGLSYFGHDMNRSYSLITEQTRYSFWLAYGIQPDMQIQIENYYKGNTPSWGGHYNSDHQSVGVPWI